ncbi:MAG: tRNA pseudouridine(55) synthase TruB [Legionellales bacterium]|nr:MAG: tRNA pseudouridine(55) synthase TruB [Legionellales bacterium]
MSPVKRYGNKINGVLLLDKATGISSNHALQRVKRLFQANKAGHTGSLDPLATGMLPICLGEATKFSQFLLDADKSYLVTIKLGIATDSGDSEGNIIATQDVPNLTLEKINSELDSFRGEITQIPPMYSALKHNGQPLYKLARQGIEIERKQRVITIKNLQIIEYDAINNILIIDVSCTKGSYMRTLAMDIGEKLQCGAHVIALRRLATGPYSQDSIMHSIENITENSTDLLHSVTSMLDNLPRLELTLQEAIDLQHGKKINVIDHDLQGLIKLYSENKFLGIGEIDLLGVLRVKRLMATES